jgi:hypothetical protein
MGCKGLEAIVELMHFQGRGPDRGQRIRSSLAAWREVQSRKRRAGSSSGDFSQ